MITGPTCPVAEKFLEEAKGEFSVNQLQRVTDLGDQLVRETGDVRLAARRVQEIAMRKMEPQVEEAHELLQGHPQLRDEIVQLRAIGALPHFHGEPPETPRPSGLPYDSQKTAEMVMKSGRM